MKTVVANKQQQREDTTTLKLEFNLKHKPSVSVLAGVASIVDCEPLLGGADDVMV